MRTELKGFHNYSDVISVAKRDDDLFLPVDSGTYLSFISQRMDSTSIIYRIIYPRSEMLTRFTGFYFHKPFGFSSLIPQMYKNYRGIPIIVTYS